LSSCAQNKLEQQNYLRSPNCATEMGSLKALTCVMGGRNYTGCW